MTKNFDNVKVGDKVYIISIRDSEIYEFPKGRTIRELKIDGIVRYPTNIYANLSDGITTIAPRKNNTAYVKDRDDDEIALSADIYATTKTECVKAAMETIRLRKNEVMKINTKCILTDNALTNTYNDLFELEVNDDKEMLTEEEFANAALS